jgi:hypothetical protein
MERSSANEFSRTDEGDLDRRSMTSGRGGGYTSSSTTVAGGGGDWTEDGGDE